MTADLAHPRDTRIAQNVRPITPAARTAGASLMCRTAMVAGDEQQTLSVSGCRPTGTRHLPAVGGARTRSSDTTLWGASPTGGTLVSGSVVSPDEHRKPLSPPAMLQIDTLHQVAICARGPAPSRSGNSPEAGPGRGVLALPAITPDALDAPRAVLPAKPTSRIVRPARRLRSHPAVSRRAGWPIAVPGGRGPAGRSPAGRRRGRAS